jgi:hypothetical protein
MNELDPPPASNQLVATALALAALIVAIVPVAVFVLAPDDGARGAWAFADAKNWIGLRWFCFASILALGPALVLARVALDRARRWPARLLVALAIFATLPLIPGAVIQATWWITG